MENRRQPKAMDSESKEKISSYVLFPLLNFDMDLEVIDFGDGIAIRRFNAEELEQYGEHIEELKEHGIIDSSVMGDARFVLLVPISHDMKTDPITGNKSFTIKMDFSGKHISEVAAGDEKFGDEGLRIAYDIISILRLNQSKMEPIAFNERFDMLAEFAAAGGRNIKPIIERIDSDRGISLQEKRLDVSGKYTVSQSDAEGLLHIWNGYRLYDFEKNRFLKTAIKRFNIGYGRINYEDKIVDYTIALEAFFCTCDEKEGVTDKISQRAAFYLRNNVEDREEMEASIKKVYQCRSYFVHGEKGRKSYSEVELWEICAQLELDLKAAITKYLLHDSNFGHEDFIKRVKRIGYE